MKNLIPSYFSFLITNKLEAGGSHLQNISLSLLSAHSVKAMKMKINYRLPHSRKKCYSSLKASDRIKLRGRKHLKI